VGHKSIRNINPNPTNLHELVPKQWIVTQFVSRDSPVSTMAGDLYMDDHQISYLTDPQQSHHVSTKRYAHMKLLIFAGHMKESIGMAENRISHFWEPMQNNNAVKLSSASDFYLRRDGVNECEMVYL